VIQAQVVSQKPYVLLITITGDMPKSMNSMLGRNPMAARGNAQMWRRRVKSAVQTKLPPSPLQKVHIQITRYSSRYLDFDSLAALAKPVIDGLVAERVGPKGERTILPGVLIDDSWKVTGPWRLDQKLCKRGKEALSILITELAEDLNLG
jgi:hypothetical protein